MDGGYSQTESEEKTVTIVREEPSIIELILAVGAIVLIGIFIAK